MTWTLTWTPPTFTPFPWEDAPSTNTPLDSASFLAEQSGLASYAQTVGSAIATAISTQAMPFQAGLRTSGTSTTIAKGELGIIATTAPITVTLPPYASGYEACSYVVKNATQGTITVVTGSAAKIDNFTGGIASSSDPITVAAETNVYVWAANHTDWLRV